MSFLIKFDEFLKMNIMLLKAQTDQREKIPNSSGSVYISVGIMAIFAQNAF